MELAAESIRGGEETERYRTSLAGTDIRGTYDLPGLCRQRKCKTVWKEVNPLPLKSTRHYSSVCASYLELESWAQRNRRINLVKHCRKQYAKYRKLLYEAIIKETQPISSHPERLHA
jgi:hypothetical protein